MPSDYSAITQENIRRRGEEFDDIGRLLSEQLYSDRTRFVYELLQNAEDALERRYQASPGRRVPGRVQFHLYPDRLEFRHFGQPFDTEDVRAICDVLTGTKSTDINQIGKFGIGFKSVYGFTSSPEVHSGDEHFCIERFIRPRQTDCCPSIRDDETVFVFPFNHRIISAQESFDLIAEKLHGLGARTLLFLTRINEITWKIRDQQKGAYRRKTEHKEGARKVILSGVDGGQKKEKWLVFERPITSGRQESHDPLKVEVAFQLVEDRAPARVKIARTNESPLVVFFPTEKETRLGFLLQGPYRTTPSRDNIPKEDRWNRFLVQESAKLVTRTLTQLKEKGLLSIHLMEAMPLRLEDFPKGEMFRPIATSVRRAFKTRALLPVNDGSYARAAQVKLARSQELRDLLRSEQLSVLFGAEKPLHWLPGEITVDRMPDLRAYLIRELGIEEVTAETVARRITVTFLEKQSDDWMSRFYTYLSGQEALWRSPRWAGDPPGPLRDRGFIRTEDGRHMAPFRSDGSPNCYLPIKRDTQFPVVRKSIAAHQGALKLLKQLGLTEPDTVAEVVELVLPKYASNSSRADISEEEHKRDINKILRALKTDSQKKRNLLVAQLLETPFMASISATGDEACYAIPGDVYLRTSETEMYFHNNPEILFLNEARGKKEWMKLGVENKPRRIPFHRRLSEKRALKIRDGSPCSRELPTVNYSLHGLTHFLNSFKQTENKDSRRAMALILWRFLGKLIDCYPKHPKNSLFHGEYRWFYYSEHKRSFEAAWVKALKTTQWLPSRHGGFWKPSEMALEDLPKGFKRDEILRKELGMKSSEIAALAGKAGIKLDDIKLLKSFPAEFRRWKTDLLESISRKAEFPARDSLNKELRQERLAESLCEATGKAYKSRQRRVRTTATTIDPATFLRNCYTNDDGQMICQICRQEMPFKKRDGSYYFEAVEFISDVRIEHEALFLALCPLCAAKYKEFVKRDPKQMEQVRRALMELDIPNIPVDFGANGASIRFVGTHYLDLRTICEENGK